MKTIGLLGGMSWESTALYYRWINELVKQQRGKLHSAKIALVSVDFQQIEELQHLGEWDKAAGLLSKAARQVQAAGADFLLICTNTMHRVAPQIESNLDIPLLHIADATADAIRQQGLHKIGLLGTKFTMEQDFYAGRLADRHSLDVITPDGPDRELVHRVIYDELVRGIVKDESRREFLRIMDGLRDRGAQGVIEGCTEIVMLVQQAHTQIPLFDTTMLHAQKAVELALR